MRLPASFVLVNTRRQFDDIEAAMRSLVPSAGEAAVAPPGDSGWSAAGIIEHLVLSGGAFLREWDLALASAQGQAVMNPGPFPYGFLLRTFLWLMEPPYRAKFKTPQPFRPRAGGAPQHVAEAFFDMHAKARLRLEAAGNVDAGAVKITSPFAKSVRYPIGFSFDIFASHERRHLWQLRQMAAARRA